MVVGDPFSTDFLNVSGYVAVPAPFLLYGARAKTFTMTMYRHGHGFGELLRLVAGVGVVAVIWVRTDSYGGWFLRSVIELSDVANGRFEGPFLGLSSVVRNCVSPVGDLRVW